jgi:uncharacterized iron-regulated membrane protein
MKTLRKVLFWIHLASGVVAGAVILVMSGTGALLALKPQILNLVDRDVRFVPPPSASTARLGVQAMVDRAREARPDGQVASIALDADRGAAAVVSLGREGSVYVDPYSGRVLGEGSNSAQVFFRALEDWHRWVGVSAENRATGRAVAAACNLAFLALAISGLYLWWPHKWLPGHVKAVLMFRRRHSTGRARDFNWHNTIGFWCAPLLIVMTTSGVVMSYPWANRLLYTWTRSPLPTPPAVERVPRAAGAAGAHAENLDQLWARAERQVPDWRTITLRLPTRAGSPLVFSISDARHWNRFARSQLTLDAATGDAVRWEPYAGTSRGQKARGWLRFAHTGELGGLPGQLAAGIGCVGGVVLVCTGLALAWRRLLGALPVVGWRVQKDPPYAERS